MKFAKIAKTLALAAIIAVSACKGRGDVDLSKATPLTAEPVNLDPKKGPFAGGPSGGANDTTQYNALFGYGIGQWVPANKAGGTIDPVGTSLNEDFDGDGITNDKETNTNIWVADYPVIETEIAPPVTMRVEVLKTSTQETSEINSDITSDELESRKNEGSEKFHQNELNEKTVQYEKEVSQSSSSSSASASASSSSTSSSTSSSSSNAAASTSAGGFGAFKGEAKITVESTTNSTSSSQNSSEHSFNATSQQQSSERTAVFEDRPFKNNLDRSGTSVKSDAAAKNARQYRKEKSAKAVNQFQTTPSGGQIRAALFIKNFSTNMPVHVSNILCSLLFETPQGVLIPVQSFRLRNDDFSLFEVDVYGGSEFGPYVVTLSNLNTVEIENALAQGYMPKIFVVDYQMTHVADSNYRAALSSSFTGNNLKIVEENAKGRTALIKIFGPNMRRMFRVAAFDVARNNMADDEACNLSTTYATNPAKAPGISLRRALQRISCDGLPVEFEHYILDFTGTELEPIRPMIYMYGIKKINGFAATAPCSGYVQGTLNIPSTVTGDPGSKLTTTTTTVNACKIRVADLTEDQIFSLGLWTVFDNGKYYKSNKYLPNTASPAVQPENRIYLYNGTSVETCGQVGQPCAIPIIAGIESKVWAGDNYDVVYMKLSDILNRVKAQIIVYGTNPLETGAALTFNTLWDKKMVGPNPFYPNVKSTFLGQAGLTDRIELEFKVNDTKFLNPTVGTPNNVIPTKATYANFGYNYSAASRENSSQLFNIDEAIDFEINPGLGGAANDWTNLRNITTHADAAVGNEWGNCGKSWDFIKQTFKVCIMVPRVLPGVDENALVNLYLRPALSNATRNAIWPEPVNEIKRFQSQLIEFARASDTRVQVYLGTGTLATDGSEANAVINVGNEATNIASSGAVAVDNRLFVVEVNAAITSAPTAGASVTVQGHSFTGTVRVDAIAGDKTLRIIPTNDATPALPLGALHSGKTITVGGTPYTIQVIRQYNKVYTIPLQYALTADHIAGEKVYIKPATTPAPQVQYSVDNGFLGAWNSAPAQGFGTLRNDGSNSCPSIFSAVNCYGYLVNQISTNWLGYRTFNNDWADASQLLTFNPDGTYSSPFANTTDNLLFSLGATAPIIGPVQFSLGKYPTATFTATNDLQVNSTLGVLAASSSSLAVQNRVAIGANAQRAIIVYPSVSGNSNVRGRVLDIVSGSLVGAGEFSIGIAGLTDSVEVAVYGNTALVIWSTCDPNLPGAGLATGVLGRYVDLTTGLPIGSMEFQVGTTAICAAYGSQSAARPKVQVDSNGKAVVVWVDSLGVHPGGAGNHHIWGRIFDLTTATHVTAQFAITNSNLWDGADGVALAIHGSTAIVAYTPFNAGSIANGNNYRYVVAAYLNTTNGTFLDSTDISPQLIIGDANNYRGPLYIAASEGTGRVAIAWLNQATTLGFNSFTSRARIIDMGTRLPLGVSNEDFLIASNFHIRELATVGNKAIAAGLTSPNPGATNCNLTATLFQLTGANNPSNLTHLTINAMGEQYCGENVEIAALPNGRALIVSSQFVQGNGVDVRGQVIDVANGMLVGSTFAITTNNADSENFPNVVLAGDKVMIAWLKGVTEGSTVGDKIYASIRHVIDPSQQTVFTYPTTLPYGPNTFFTAPLIERNYTVTSKIKF